MDLNLAANISKYRKINSMTQEQLASSLGVTFAAVSKWERGVANPELVLIAQMADLFSISVDVLIGYDLRNNNMKTVIDRLKKYTHDVDNTEAISDIDIALQRFPNTFDIVYHSAVNYRIRGISSSNISYLKKGLQLYKHACALIEQNSNPEISEVGLNISMAHIHIITGEIDKGIEILKNNNPCRVNHALIGTTLSQNDKAPEEALSYLSTALIDLSKSQIEIVIGFVNVYQRTKEYKKAIAILEWGLGFYPGLKKEGKTSFLDKIEAIIWTVKAEMHSNLNEADDVGFCLEKAKLIASGFDKTPNHDASNIEFVTLKESLSYYDDMGETAIDAVIKIINDSDTYLIKQLWEKVYNEETKK